jgi:hypothetical protein
MVQAGLYENAPKRLTDDAAEALMSGKRYGGELWTFGKKPKKPR